jgi:hypothetical protein
MMFGGAGAFVLCFGQGGHLAIEFAHEGGHDHTSNHMEGHDTEHHGSISDDGCNSCFDLPLTVDNTEPHTVTKDETRTETHHAHESVMTASCTVDPARERLFTVTDRSPPLRHSLENLATVILRT